MLFIQMILTIIMLVASVYLLIFVASNNLSGWMLTSYIFIIISVVAMICYGIFGYKKSQIAYLLTVAPFLGAIFVNILLPNRDTFQIALLSLLFALNFAFLLRQKDKRFTYIISVLMVAVALTFSIYSSITANTQFLGDISKNWPTYFSMYLSIFIPSIMSTTFAITYNVRMTRLSVEQRSAE